MSDDPADDVPTDAGPVVTAPGDLWLLEPHRLVRDSTLDLEHLDRLMDSEGPPDRLS